MTGVQNYIDGLLSTSNEIINQRNAMNNNSFSANRIYYPELRAIMQTGLGSKIVRLKIGASLSDTIKFTDDRDETFFNDNLLKDVQRAAKFMIAFGRGIIVIYKRGDDLSKPLGKPDRKYSTKTFSGDMVTPGNVSRDFMSDRYNKPMEYIVNAATIHHTRVIDFTYVEPSEYDLPTYLYGGISEFELVYPQLVQDGIIERATPSLIDKNSSLFYKVDGLRNAMKQKNDGDIVTYFTVVENMRSIMGATILDDKDTVEVHNQQLTNLADVDRIGLRRLAMVTGIPLPYLVGEAVQGMNSTGDNERAIWGDTIKHLQSGYLIDPINELTNAFGIEKIEFKEGQGSTDKEVAEIAAIHVENAVKLQMLGEDYNSYLIANGITTEGEDSE